MSSSTKKRLIRVLLSSLPHLIGFQRFEVVKLFSIITRKNKAKFEENLLNIHTYIQLSGDSQCTYVRGETCAWPQSCLCGNMVPKHKKQASPVVTHSITKHFQPVAKKCRIHQLSARTFTHLPSTAQRDRGEDRHTGKETCNKKLQNWRVM